MRTIIDCPSRMTNLCSPYLTIHQLWPHTSCDQHLVRSHTNCDFTTNCDLESVMTVHHLWRYTSCEHTPEQSPECQALTRPSDDHDKFIPMFISNLKQFKIVLRHVRGFFGIVWKFSVCFMKWVSMNTAQGWIKIKSMPRWIYCLTQFSSIQEN